MPATKAMNHQPQNQNQTILVNGHEIKWAAAKGRYEVWCKGQVVARPIRLGDAVEMCRIGCEVRKGKDKLK